MQCITPKPDGVSMMTKSLDLGADRENHLSSWQGCPNAQKSYDGGGGNIFYERTASIFFGDR